MKKSWLTVETDCLGVLEKLQAESRDGAAAGRGGGWWCCESEQWDGGGGRMRAATPLP